MLFQHLTSVSKLLEKANVQFVILEIFFFHVESIEQKGFLLQAVCHVSPKYLLCTLKQLILRSYLRRMVFHI